MPERSGIPEQRIEPPTDGVGLRGGAEHEVQAERSSTSDLAIIASKIRPAGAPASVLTRPRLVGWLDQQRSTRVVLVLAEAGWGKSTLLADYSHRTDSICIWYRLESSDRDWITYLSHLVAAMREAFPEFGRPTEALLRHVAAMGPSREVVVAQFLADLDEVDGRDVVVIFDDFHLVDGSDDVRVIMGRLFERAPDQMRFVLAGRIRPSLALGRIGAQGRLAELTTNDLRFTRPEIGQLFESAYAQPLEEEVCDIVAERTQGWAASLQLVSASIRASRPSEVASFIDALSGADGPIYDFLAEEVLGRLPSLTQRVLLHASLIDRVRAELVTAAMSTAPSAPSIADVSACLREVEILGLLGQRGDTRADLQIHPLLRQFLEHHLNLDVSPERLAAMHSAIAREAEATDWLVAGKHFALAHETDEAMRVLGSAASQALGTGAWGAAAEVIAAMPHTTPPPAVEVIKARALVSAGRTDEALDLLDRADGFALTAEERGLVGLTRAAALHSQGEADSINSEISRVSGDAAIPSPLRDVAAGWRLMLEANDGGSISDVVTALDELAKDLIQAGLHHFAGVTLHNNANAELARGNYVRALKLSRDAVEQLSRADDADHVIASTHSISAASLAEMGEFEEGLRTAELAASRPDATADAIAEAVYLHSVLGRSHRAHSLLARLDRGAASGTRELSARAQLGYGRFAVMIAAGERRRAEEALQGLRAVEAADIDSRSRVATLRASLAALHQRPSGPELAAVALSTASGQNAWRWITRARIVDAATRQDPDALAMWIVEAADHSALAILELAEVIARSLHMLDPIPQALEMSIARHPARWLPALKHEVQAMRDDSANVAAILVSRFGGLTDAQVLQDFDRSRNGRVRRRSLVSKLIRRVSATVRVHDLGPSSFEVGDRLITLAESRRKVAALLMFLVTRSNFAASREQVMESLWPDQLPKSALNSLHQTLFFLRREIEPWYEDGATADYVRLESDQVFLDGELFQVDSVAFGRQCASILASKSALAQGPLMLRLYRGRFAPEFEYEEWAEDWRTQLHGTYLRLAYATGESLVHEGRFSEAVDVLTTVTTIDPMAFDLRSMLVASLASLGATDAARAHYESLAALHLRDLGVAARPFDELVRSPP